MYLGGSVINDTLRLRAITACAAICLAPAAHAADDEGPVLSLIHI